MSLTVGGEGGDVGAGPHHLFPPHLILQGEELSTKRMELANCAFGERVSWGRGRCTKKGTDNKKMEKGEFSEKGIMVHGIQRHGEVQENKDKMRLDLAIRRPLLVPGIAGSVIMDRISRGPNAARCLCGKFFIHNFSVEEMGSERVRDLFMVTEPGVLSPTFLS